MLNQQNQQDQQSQLEQFIDPNQISMGIELVGDPLLIDSYVALSQHDNDPDELYYHNAATCPDCGQGMMRLGDQLACPGCGCGG